MRDAGIATAGKKTHSFAGKEVFVSFLNDGHQLATIQPDRDFERNFPGRTFLDCRTGQAAGHRTENRAYDLPFATANVAPRHPAHCGTCQRADS